MLTPDQKKEIQQMIDFTLRNNYRKKIGDTPTDNLQLTPRGYVNMNGSVAARPIGSVASVGQSYFASDTGIPMTFNGTQWVNGIGSVVAIR